MTDDQHQHDDEVGRILASDPNAQVVEGEPQAWLLTDVALEVAKDALGRSQRD